MIRNGTMAIVRALACVVPGVCLLMLNICGVADTRLSLEASTAARAGYAPQAEDYYIAAYRHGFPFHFLTRHGGKGDFDGGSLAPMPSEVPATEFSETSTRWPIDDAPVVFWSWPAFAGNAALNVVILWGIWFLVPVLLTRTNCDDEATPQAVGATRRTPLTHGTFDARWLIALITIAPVLLISAATLLQSGGSDHQPAPTLSIPLQVTQNAGEPHAPGSAQDSSVERNGSAERKGSIVVRNHFEGESAGESRADNGLEVSLVWCPPGSLCCANIRGFVQPRRDISCRGLKRESVRQHRLLDFTMRSVAAAMAVGPGE